MGKIKKQESSPEKRAKSFIATRNRHLLELAEDYVELIDDLIKEKGSARTCDIAAHLGVSHVTAVKTIKRLTEKGFLNATAHKAITLTELGKKMAFLSRERHTFLLNYLLALGVTKEVAEIDVEGMEHHVSHETLTALQKHFSRI